MSKTARDHNIVFIICVIKRFGIFVAKSLVKAVSAHKLKQLNADIGRIGLVADNYALTEIELGLIGIFIKRTACFDILIKTDDENVIVVLSEVIICRGKFLQRTESRFGKHYVEIKRTVAEDILVLEICLFVGRRKRFSVFIGGIDKIIDRGGDTAVIFKLLFIGKFGLLVGYEKLDNKQLARKRSERSDIRKRKLFSEGDLREGIKSVSTLFKTPSSVFEDRLEGYRV